MAEDAETDEKEDKPKRKGNPLKVVAFALIGLGVFGLIGLGVYIFVFPDDWPKPFYVSVAPPAEAAPGPTPEPGPEEPEPVFPAALPKPGEGLMYDTGTKIVNLTDPGGRRYLKVSVALEFAPHDAAFYTLTGEARVTAVTAFAEEMSSKKPVIDDLLNTLLSSKTFDQIYSVEGKEALRQDVIARVNALLPGELLMYVYFTEFVVQ